MKNVIYFIYTFSVSLITLVLLSMSACERETIPPIVEPPGPTHDSCRNWIDTMLPPMTHEGLNTVGCLINGQIWIPRIGKVNDVENSIKMPIDFRYITDPQYANVPRFRFWAAKNFQNPCDTAFSLLAFGNVKVFEGGTYLINNDYPLNSHHGESIGGDHPLIRDGKSYLTIDFLDSTKRIIAGRFGMNLYDYKWDTVRITEGRFDVIYDPNNF